MSTGNEEEEEEVEEEAAARPLRFRGPCLPTSLPVHLRVQGLRWLSLLGLTGVVSPGSVPL